MLENLNKYHIILASNSPRRKELLSGLEIKFDVWVLPGIDETYPNTLKGGDIPLYISRAKAKAYLPIIKANDLVITADTLVDVDGEVLGKPHHFEAAVDMLKKLSGKTHEVFTGVTLSTLGWQRSFTAETKVTFADLSDDEINYYLNRYQPFDKAGSYGVQEWIGYIGVKKMEGSYFNVMGLPVQRLYTELKQI